jgi:hypothetical protein
VDATDPLPSNLFVGGEFNGVVRGRAKAGNGGSGADGDFNSSGHGGGQARISQAPATGAGG